MLRETRAQAAILETARGGILRRGIAMSQAHAAIVTNVSPDHFGEYGIHDLAGLAEVKMSVAAAVRAGGLFGAPTPTTPFCGKQAEQLGANVFGQLPALGWFSAADGGAVLEPLAADGASTCGPHQGRLRLTHAGHTFDLGAIADLPLSMGGVARYNIGNLSGAALGAMAMGISPARIAAVFAKFGADLDDNPGRLIALQCFTGSPCCSTTPTIRTDCADC